MTTADLAIPLPDTTDSDTEAAIPAPTNTFTVRLRRHSQNTALWLTRTPLRRPGRSLVVLALAYVATQAVVTVTIVLATYLTLVVIAVSGSEARVRASTLIKTLTFAYRRWRVCRKFRSVMLHASIAESPTSQGEKLRHGDDAKITPRVLARLATPTPVGLRIVVDGHKIGADAFAFQQRAHVIRTEFGCRDISISPDPVKPYRTVLQLTYSDPFKTPIAWRELPAPSARGLVVVGLDEMGNAVEKSFWLSQLIAGSPGSGKSSEAWCQIKGLIEARIPFLVHIYDPKGGTEFHNMAGNAWSYESSDFAGFVQRLLGTLTGRMRALHEAGLRECPEGDPRFPLHVVVVDELVTAILLAKSDKSKVDFEGKRMPVLQALIVFMTQIRSAGIIVLGLTQIVQKTVLDVLRGLFALGTCMRIGDAESVRIMLGEEAPKNFPAHRIPAIKRTAGIAYTTSEETGQVTKYRGGFLDDAERDSIAVACGVWSAHYREVFTGRGPRVREPVDEWPAIGGCV